MKPRHGLLAAAVLIAIAVAIPGALHASTPPASRAALDTGAADAFAQLDERSSTLVAWPSGSLFEGISLLEQLEPLPEPPEFEAETRIGGLSFLGQPVIGV